jgi:hypothetical protein
MANPTFAPGFRLSPVDLLVLILGGLLSAALAYIDLSYCLVVCIPLAHFFIFCNVFRVSCLPELVWAGIFVIIAGSTLVSGIPGWWVTVLVAVCICLVVVLAEMQKPFYHGIF